METCRCWRKIDEKGAKRADKKRPIIPKWSPDQIQSRNRWCPCRKYGFISTASLMVFSESVNIWLNPLSEVVWTSSLFTRFQSRDRLNNLENERIMIVTLYNYSLPWLRSLSNCWNVKNLLDRLQKISSPLLAWSTLFIILAFLQDEEQRFAPTLGKFPGVRAFLVLSILLWSALYTSDF